LRNADDQPSTSLLSSDCGLDAYPELATSRHTPRSPSYDPWQFWVSRGQVAELLGKARASKMFSNVPAYGVLRYAELADDLPVG